MSPPDLKGRVVVVAGAGGRLGRVLVARLEAAGARVAALDAVRPEGVGALAVEADLSDEGAVARAFDELSGSLGPPDALVHVVGMWDGAPLAETTLEAWDRVLRINLTSAFLCFREAARRMAGREGRLVAIAARQGADAGAAEQVAYSASKGGLVRLVEATAAEYRDGGLTAAAVAPSTMLFGGEATDAKGVAAEDVADLCVYLCGPGGAVHNGAVLRAYGSG